ncbi:MAG: HAMP domain-containing sensor histidine kinase [Candidatus Metalachnospira sp.]|nr:HAMP domain-containing sensor histidine kinase [Candidatus Metalachnospira sp.]
MATKLKKFKLYSIKVKAAAVILIFVLGLISCVGMVYVVDVRYGSGLNYNSYFETETFYSQYSQLVRDVVNVNLVYKSEDNIKAGNALNEEKIIYNFALDNELGEYTIFNAIGQPIKVLFSDANDQAYFNERYTDYRQQAIQDQLYEYDDAVKELDRYSDFYYCLINTKNNAEISNHSADEIENLDISSFLDGKYSKGTVVYDTEYYYNYSDDGKLINYFYYDNYLDSVSRILLNSGYSMYAGVNSEGDGVFTKQDKTYETRKELAPKAVTAAVVGSIGIALGLCYLAYVAGKSGKNSEVTLIAVDHIFNDIHTLIFIAIAVASKMAASNMISSVYYVSGQWINVVRGLVCFLFMIDIAVLISYVTSMSRQMKKRQLLSNTIIGATIRTIASFFKSSTFRIWVIICSIVFAVMNCMLTVIGCKSQSIIPFVIIVVFDVSSIFFVARALNSLKKIMEAVKETADGNFDKGVNLDKISPSMRNFASDVSNMQSGLNQAVGRAVKGEKMKTELITNVSHDLKTPLTSIITYVDLLKREQLNNEKAENYVAILDEKARRLKQLIEDLVEASKASSGNLAVTRTKLNLRELMVQALGEFEEKIEGSGLEFKFNATDDVMVFADGSHMWRIAENLISNAIKYTMPKTRVFIDILKTETEGVLVIKNVSLIPIDEVDIMSLTERFVRGDASRTMDGAGLGLSITQSLTEIQGGKLDISVDGDVFKVTVKMPLYTE